MKAADLQDAAVRLADVALALHCLADPPRALTRADVSIACAAAAVAVDRVIEDLGDVSKAGH